ncbi:putative Phosphatidylinositol N-acetylglucosaminyltransferase [Microbacterium sp. C448]|uniref:glycosyltransferase family 4 protein n=1 Tax=Microbacterium sp. C448 TaxID=1177594 RepID=UPI0003DDF7E0|nr:glycosyltransferase family 4 protein [Microbacterium sp. C448]CDK01848.1 putative Phosphatidylinositol N-acetylglucosaminyltransferase [Microbacterium sp. C448]
MRVAMSSFRFNNEGGIERASYELALRIQDRIDLTLVATDVDPLPEPPLKWLRVEARSKPGFIVPVTYSAAATRALDGQGFDIIHNQGGCATRVQDVITAHSCHRAWWEMKFRNGEALRALANPFHHAVLRVEQRNYRPGGVRRAIAVSPTVGRELTRYYGVDPDLITVIPNAVDVTRFQPTDAAARRARIRTQHGYIDDDVVLLFVGKEFRRKGLRAIIDALPALPITVKLLVVGGDDAGPFRSRAAELGVADRVTFVGHSPVVEDYFQASDIFVFPTMYEPFGLVELEAAASGLPLVATNLGVAEEFIVEGENGAVIERDGASIARVLRPLVDDRDLRRRMGERARRDAAGYTSWESVAEQTLAVYERVHQEKLAGHTLS